MKNLKALLAVLAGYIAKQTNAQPYGAAGLGLGTAATGLGNVASGLGNTVGTTAFGYVDQLANSLLNGDLISNIYKNLPPPQGGNQQGYNNKQSSGDTNYVGGGNIQGLGTAPDLVGLGEGAIGDIGNERFFTNRAFAFKTKGTFTRDSNVLVCSGLNSTHGESSSSSSDEAPYHRPSDSSSGDWSNPHRYNTVTMTGASFQGSDPYGNMEGDMGSDPCGKKVELFEKGDAFASIGSLCTDTLFTCSMNTMASINGFYVEFFTDARDPTSCLIERVSPDVVLACFKLTPRIKRSEWQMHNRTADGNIAKFCWDIQAINPGAAFVLRRPFKQLRVPTNLDNNHNNNNYQAASPLNTDSIYTSQYYNPAAGTGGSSSYDSWGTSAAGIRNQDVLVESGQLQMLKTRQFDFIVNDQNKKQPDIHNQKDNYGGPQAGPGGGPNNNYGPQAGPGGAPDKDKHVPVVFKCPKFVY